MGRLVRRRRPVDLRLLRVHAQPQRAADHVSAASEVLLDRCVRGACRAGDPRRAEGAKAVFLNVAPPNAPHTLSVGARARLEGLPALPPPRYADRFATAPLPRYPNFDEADVSDKPPFLGAIWPRLTSEQIAGAHRALPGTDGLAARRRRPRRARCESAEAQPGLSQHRHHLHVGQRLDPRRAPARRSNDRGWQRQRGEVLPLRGSARVPLIAAGPDFPARRTVSGPVVNADRPHDHGHRRRSSDAPARRHLAPGCSSRPDAAERARRPARDLREPARRAALPIDPNRALPLRRLRHQRTRALRPGSRPGAREPARRPAVCAIEAILARALTKLQACKGADCRVDVGDLPEPGV